ncbi:uncharacterized protein LOC130727906 isoform X2 [Lotus japonicus]|uniref:uncharacterized protein LOC130727906 isoform X2 n=1 Tax=Lotus japonicus TaxID=34305 RepID=UPI0025830FB7|nr:uncharacterized protein LOC130727906 isoform X2 [Lotus japonicus]
MTLCIAIGSMTLCIAIGSMTLCSRSVVALFTSQLVPSRKLGAGRVSSPSTVAFPSHKIATFVWFTVIAIAVLFSSSSSTTNPHFFLPLVPLATPTSIPRRFRSATCCKNTSTRSRPHSLPDFVKLAQGMSTRPHIFTPVALPEETGTGRCFWQHHIESIVARQEKKKLTSGKFY